MVGKWTESDTMKFIYYYRLHECLWNTKSEFYNMRDARNAAYADLAMKMGMSEFDVRAVKVKIKNLRAHYISELKKMRVYKQLGQDYHPTLYWFSEMDAFLRDIVADLPTMQNPEVITGDSIFDCSSIYENAFANEDGKKASPIFHLPETNHAAPKPKKRYKPGPACKKRKRPFDDEKRTTEKKTSDKRNVDKRPKTDAKEIKCDATPMDEFEVFGRSVAAQLRMLTLSRALRAQTKIQSMLAEERILDLENSDSPSMRSSPVISENAGLSPIISEVKGGEDYPKDDTGHAAGSSSNGATCSVNNSLSGHSYEPMTPSNASSNTNDSSKLNEDEGNSQFMASTAPSSSFFDTFQSVKTEPNDDDEVECVTEELEPVNKESAKPDVKTEISSPPRQSPPPRVSSPRPSPPKTPPPEEKKEKKEEKEKEEKARKSPVFKANYHIIKAECEVITLDEDDPLEGCG